jgi:N-acetylmuramoyl-L-alanine amidase
MKINGLALFALIFFLSFAARGGEGGRVYASFGGGESGLKLTPAVSRASIGLDDFARQHNLTLVSAPGAGSIELVGKGVSLLFAPGLPMAAVNGQSSTLTQAPFVLRGEVRLPVEMESLLPSASTRIDGTVVLDAGHGGNDTGCTGFGLREKDVALDICLRAGELLRRRGARVFYTRSRDEFIELSRRSEIANSQPDAILVSVHLNSVATGSKGRENARGVETFVLSGRITEGARVSAAARKYDLAGGAEAVSYNRKKEIIAALSGFSRDRARTLGACLQQRLVGELGETDRGVKQKNLAVLRETYFVPAVLTEVGFLSHPATAKKFKSAEHRQRVAEALTAGIADYFACPE